MSPHAMADPPSLPPLPAGPIALFLDVDGTLIDIAPRPEAVVVPPELLRHLTALDAELDGALALVSGRSIADIDRLFAPLRLRASGVHGAETRTDPAGPVLATASHKLPDDLAAAVSTIADQHAGAFVEHKGYSLAVHYRANPGAGPALRDALEACASGSGPGLVVMPGHMVFELKGTGFDKGRAITGFMRDAPFQGRRPVFIGDDVTDLPGFAAALAAGGLAFSVTTPRAGTSGHFAEPDQVRRWLGELARDGSARARPDIDPR